VKLIPETFFWRTVLLIWLVILLSQLSTLLFAFYNLYIPDAKQKARLMDLEITTLQAGVSKVGKKAFLEMLETRHGMRVTDDLSEVPEVPDFPFADLFLVPMAHELGDDIEVRIGFLPSPGYWFTASKLEGIWIHVPLDNFGRYEGIILLFWVFGTPSLAFWAAALVVLQLGKPLKRLETAARKIGAGESVDSLRADNGPREVIEVNRAFNQMNKNLLQADRERALLLAGVSHDLRTPLTRLRLTAELLGVSDSELTEGMVRDVEDMDAILDQFISFVRDGRDETAEFEDLNEVLLEVATQFEGTDVVIRNHLKMLPRVLVKRLSMKRVFSNLIGNAVLHGGGSIDIFTSTHGEEVSIVIADRGPGISEDQISALFQPFARGDESRGSPGSGLGLAIVKRIVELHYGRVELRSREGGGLQACITLPVSGERTILSSRGFS